MKVVVLAGGLGSRLSEETVVRPKPMVEIGGKPILWHIFKIYSSFGFNDFIVCLGYKGYMIKEFFANYRLHTSDVTIDLSRGSQTEIHESYAEPWRVTLVDTGMDTQTGGRVRRIRQYTNDEPFMLTYGDGVADIDVDDLVRFHKAHGRLATMTAVQPPGRFGALDMDEGDRVRSFREKPSGDGGWINGGFFVMEPEIFSYLENDATVLERAPLERLAEESQLVAYRHGGFWWAMDTLRDKNHLEALWQQGNPPWRTWKS